MINKICPVCGKLSEQYSANEKQLINNETSPENPGAKYVYNLWHKTFDMCSNCNFSCLDFNNENVTDKNFINSVGFNNLLDNKELGLLENLITPTYKPFLFSAYYYEKNNNNFLSSIGYFNAAENLFSDELVWEREIADELNEEEQKISDYCFSLISELNKRALEQIDLAISKNKTNVDYYLFKAVILFGTSKNEQALEVLNYALKNLKLTIPQIDAIKFLKN